VKQGSLVVALKRRGNEPRGYKGTVRVTAGRTLVGRGRFSLAKGRTHGRAKMPLTRAGRRLLGLHGTTKVRIRVRTRGARGAPVVSSYRLKP
jgi:hypothetical protein